MSRWIIDASLTLGWYLKDEEDRSYNLEVLAGLKTNEGFVPFLWTYEVSNGLVMAHRRKRLSIESIGEILESLNTLPIVIDPADSRRMLQLATLALNYQLTSYVLPI